MVALPTSPVFTYVKTAGGQGQPQVGNGGTRAFPTKLVSGPRSILLAGVLSALALLLVSSSIISKHDYDYADGSNNQVGGIETHSYTTRLGSLIKHYTWSSTREPSNLTEWICPECNCSIPGFYSLSPRFSTPLPSLSDIRGINRKNGIQTTPPLHKITKRTLKKYLISEIQHYMWLHPIFTPPTALSPLFQTFFTCPDQLLRLNFNGLQFDKPTIYMYTRTGDGGRLKANERRLRYFQRHIDTLREYNLLEEQRLLDADTYKDSEEQRQLIWIIVEDAEHLNEQVDALLNSTGLPYLYFAHGPTRFYGNAQWNAAERAVHVLRDSFFGNGPVLNVDDDSKIMPELLQLIWKVKKVVMWTVGNLGGWEGPLFSNGKIVDWKIAGLPNRAFPIDMGGFAYNSSLIGDGRHVSPPSYVPENHFGGESEFIAQMLKSRDEIEPLCENSILGKCHYAWHNWRENEKENSPA